MQFAVGHAATVKLPLPVRCAVTYGGQGHSPFLARLDQGLGHCPKLIQCLLGDIPQAMQPCRAGTSALCGCLSPRSPLAVIPRLIGRTASPRWIWAHSKTAWLPGRVTLM